MMDQENAPALDYAIVSLDDNEIEPLTGKPFFNMTMGKSYLQSYLSKAAFIYSTPTMPFAAGLEPLRQLPLPIKFLELLPANVTVPVILTRGSRSWHMKYAGYNQKKFHSGWNAFVVDNMLNLGDVCLFELMSCDVTTLIKFKVQILRGDLPPALLNKERQAQDAPVVIEIE